MCGWFLTCPGHLPTPIWEPKAQKHRGMCPSRTKVHSTSDAQRSDFPRCQEIMPHSLAPIPHPPHKGSPWNAHLQGDHRTVCRAGRTCSFWNSDLDKGPFSLCLPEPRARSLGQETGCFLTSAPSVLGASQSCSGSQIYTCQPQVSIGPSPVAFQP